MAIVWKIPADDPRYEIALAVGPIAERPPVPEKQLFWYATDLDILSLYTWQDATWINVIGGSASYSAKGEIVVGTGAGSSINLPPGADGMVLIADSTQASGVRWGTVASTSTAYIHSQPIAALTWTINHNLGFQPSVELMDLGFNEIDGDVTHLSANVTQVDFNVAQAGYARLT